jgi:hypothetical protein
VGLAEDGEEPEDAGQVAGVIAGGDAAAGESVPGAVEQVVAVVMDRV